MNNVWNTTGQNDQGNSIIHSCIYCLNEKWYIACNYDTAAGNTDPVSLRPDSVHEQSRKKHDLTRAGIVPYCGAENSGNTTHEVASLMSSGSPLYDMLGNVAEWCWPMIDHESKQAGTTRNNQNSQGRLLAHTSIPTRLPMPL
ncbi:SUMF1/EgtB/PvdO family nonheme iron enzyme [bacterium]|nr:SUMF1/EgtB/PvdO family nonheme iron enzyme [bacterium]